MIPQFEQYFIRKNHSKILPSRMVYFDTETFHVNENGVQKHRMKLAWTCYIQNRGARAPKTENWRFWRGTEGLWTYIAGLAKAKTNLYLFGHNIFFDLQCSDFFYYLTRWGWELDFVYDKGMTYILYIHKDKARIKCLSTTNYYPVSLKKLGDLVGLPKMDVDFEESSIEDLTAYCYRDVEIIKATMEKYYEFIRKHDLGRFAASKAGQAFTAYRHRFMTKKICVHRDEDISDFERKAYHGGRVDCNYLGEVKGGPFVSLDVNSMYPFVMHTFKYPTKLVDYIERPDPEIFQHIFKDRSVIAHVYVNTPEPVFAYRKNNRVTFPVGRFDVHLCTEGLKYAYARGYIEAVGAMAVYEHDNIFQDYVDYFYDLKKHYTEQGDKIMTFVTKHFLNNLYGKFAQKTPLIEEEEAITFDGYSREETYDAVTGKTEIVTKLFNKLFVQWGEQTAKTSFVAISAHITEYARFHLWKIIKDIGTKRVIYCDTDSLKIRQKDLKRLTYPIHAYDLGALKIENKTYCLVIYGPKDYHTEDEKRLKGVPNKALRHGRNIFIYTNFPRQDTHLRKQVTRYFIAKPMTKTLKREYTKGQVSSSGVVTPFQLSLEPPPSMRLLAP